jgi:hypothetical protein
MEKTDIHAYILRYLQEMYNNRGLSMYAVFNGKTVPFTDVNKLINRLKNTDDTTFDSDFTKIQEIFIEVKEIEQQIQKLGNGLLTHETNGQIYRLSQILNKKEEDIEQIVVDMLNKVN